MGGDGGSLFDRENLNVFDLSITMTGLIVFTIVFEFFLHKLHRKVKGIPHYEGIFNKMTQELMILGFVSFVLLLVIEIAKPNPSKLLVFEFAHLWFFFIAIWYMIHAYIFTKTSTNTKKLWHRTDAMSRETLSATYYREMRFKNSVMAFFFNKTQAKRGIEFLIFKSLFNRVHNLPRSFSLPKYLHISMDKYVVGSMDVKESTWLVLIILLGINLSRSIIMGETHHINYFAEIVYYLIMGYALLFVVIVLLYTIKRAKTLMIKNAAETLDANDLVGVLSSLEERRKQEELIQENDIENYGSLRMTHFDTFFDLMSNDTKESIRIVGGAFPCASPRVFSIAMDVCLLLQCFYLGLVMMLMIPMCVTHYPGYIGVLLILAYLFPMMLSIFWCFPQILSEFVFVRSVGYLDKDVIAKVVHWTDEIKQLKKNFVKRIYFAISEENKNIHFDHAKLNDKLLEIFSKYDYNGDKKLNYKEFKEGFRTLGMEFSYALFLRVCFQFDSDQDDHINYEEFIQLFISDLPRDPLVLMRFLQNGSVDEGSVTRQISEEFLVHCKYCNKAITLQPVDLIQHSEMCKKKRNEEKYLPMSAEDSVDLAQIEQVDKNFGTFGGFEKGFEQANNELKHIRVVRNQPTPTLLPGQMTPGSAGPTVPITPTYDESAHKEIFQITD